MSYKKIIFTFLCLPSFLFAQNRSWFVEAGGTAAVYSVNVEQKFLKNWMAISIGAEPWFNLNRDFNESKILDDGIYIPIRLVGLVGKNGNYAELGISQLAGIYNERRMGIETGNEYNNLRTVQVWGTIVGFRKETQKAIYRVTYNPFWTEDNQEYTAFGGISYGRKF